MLCVYPDIFCVLVYFCCAGQKCCSDCMAKAGQQCIRGAACNITGDGSCPVGLKCCADCGLSSNQICIPSSFPCASPGLGRYKWFWEVEWGIYMFTLKMNFFFSPIWSFNLFCSLGQDSNCQISACKCVVFD